MPIGIQTTGGNDWKAKLGSTEQGQALKTLRDIQSHLSLPGKAKGVLTLVNRSHDDRELTLKRKSGLQLLGRGRNNERLNDTTHAIRTLLKNAGLDGAEEDLNNYLYRRESRNENRISARALLNLLNKCLPQPEVEPEAQRGSEVANMARADAESVDLDEALAQMMKHSSVADVSDDDQLMMNVRPTQAADARPAMQVQQPVQASRPVPYVGAELYPPKAIGRSVDELLSQAKMFVPADGQLGAGAFGVVSKLQVPGQATPMVLKTFTTQGQQVLSTARNGSVNEAMAAYLTSEKDASYAARVNVVQPEFYLVEQGGKHMMLEPLALRALLKPANRAMGAVHCVGLVMKKAEGEEVLKIMDQLSLAQRKQVFKGTLQAVSTLNERGFIHRDIKEENVFFDTRTGKVSLIDTGMLHKRSKNVPGSGQVRELAGTPPFMHPKVWAGRPHGTEADLYSSAMMALELHSPSTMRLIQKHYIRPIKAQMDNGRPIRVGDRLFSKRSLAAGLDRVLANSPASGATPSRQAIRDEIAAFRAELDDNTSFASFIMDCLDAATASPQEFDWTDPRETAQVYQRILNDPRLSMA
jgi:serine/threonine protein kinase